MIEILDPGWLSLIVDHGRHGFADLGVAPSSALDRYAFDCANLLAGNPEGSPLIEVVGSGFSFRAESGLRCAVTGAKVLTLVDGNPMRPWSSFPVARGSVVKVREVEEGLRYYLAFSGVPVAEAVMGSFATHLEGRFGGFRGRPLMKGDVLELANLGEGEGRAFPPEAIPRMASPHILRFMEGPEKGYFTGESVGRAFSPEGGGFTVSARLNRTAVRLEGEPLVFREGALRSIISEGLVPGTIQVPGDGLPMITLYERTVGGYARIGVVIRADRDILAHLKPGDKVAFVPVAFDEAARLWAGRRERYHLPA